MLQNQENISSNPQTNASKKYRKFSFAPTELKVFAVFTLSVIIPTFWALVILLSPRITKFCKSLSKSNITT